MIGQAPGPVMRSLSAAEGQPAGGDAPLLAAAARRVESAEVFGDEGSGGFVAKRPRVEDSKGAILFVGGTGSQGAALAYAASQSVHEHGREVLILVRDRKKAEAVQVEVDGKAHKLGEMPGVRFVTEEELKGADASRMIIFNTAPAAALANVLRTLNTLSTAPHAHVASFNGIGARLPSGMRVPEHAVSMIPSFAVPEKPSTFAFRQGTLIVDKSSVVAKDLALIFGKTFGVQLVESGPHAQWTKIAVNTAANSLATLRGIKVMELRAQIDADKDDLQRLLKGIVAEVCMLAGKDGIEFDLDTLYNQVLAKIPPTMDHFTSTGVMFRAGTSLKEDIASLSGAVGAPICDKLARSLAALEAARGAGAMPADFYERDDVKEIQATLRSPELLALADQSVAAAAQRKLDPDGQGEGAPEFGNLSKL